MKLVKTTSQFLECNLLLLYVAFVQVWIDAFLNFNSTYTVRGAVQCTRLQDHIPVRVLSRDFEANFAWKCFWLATPFFPS